MPMLLRGVLLASFEGGGQFAWGTVEDCGLFLTGEGYEIERTSLAHDLAAAWRQGLVERALSPPGTEGGKRGRPPFGYRLTDKGRERLAWYRAGGELPQKWAGGVEPDPVHRRKRRQRGRPYRFNRDDDGNLLKRG